MCVHALSYNLYFLATSYDCVTHVELSFPIRKWICDQNNRAVVKQGILQSDIHILRIFIVQAY